MNGPNLINPEDDGLKAKLLETLMDEMDNRIAKSSFKDKLKPKEEESKAPAAPQPDDIDADTSLDPDFKALLKAKKGMA